MQADVTHRQARTNWIKAMYLHHTEQLRSRARALCACSVEWCRGRSAAAVAQPSQSDSQRTKFSCPHPCPTLGSGVLTSVPSLCHHISPSTTSCQDGSRVSFDPRCATVTPATETEDKSSQGHGVDTADLVAAVPRFRVSLSTRPAYLTPRHCRRCHCPFSSAHLFGPRVSPTPAMTDASKTKAPLTDKKATFVSTRRTCTGAPRGRCLSFPCPTSANAVVPSGLSL